MSSDSIVPPPGTVVDVLVVSAYAPELRGLRTALGEQLFGEIRGMRVMGKCLGIGLPAASAGMMKRLYQLSPRTVILVGTCGVYPGLSNYQPCDVVVASRVALLDHAALAGRVQYPEPLQTSLELHGMMAAGLTQAGTRRARTAPVATTLGITTDDVLGASVPPRTGCEVENLEAFGVALACRTAEVPFAAVLGVSNVCGSRAREDWKTYERNAGLAAAEVVVNWIHNGCAGMPHSPGRISQV